MVMVTPPTPLSSVTKEYVKQSMSISSEGQSRYHQLSGPYRPHCNLSSPPLQPESSCRWSKQVRVAVHQ